MSVTARLEELGITLPSASVPAANYVPTVRTGNLLYVSGQIPILDGDIAPEHLGRVGDAVTIEQAQAAARVCGLNMLAHVQAACGGDLNQVTRVVRLGIYVSSAEDFTQQPQVGNGVSDLMVEVFGSEVGSHSRAAVGVYQLPRGIAVEVDGVFSIST